jgi:outer membrane protein TolC
MDSDLENIDQMFDMNYNWNVSLTLSLPLFAGFSVYNNYRLSVSELKSAEFSKEILIKSAEKELASARLEYCSDLERYKLSGIRIDLAKEEMRFAEKSYEEGLVTMLDVIQARNGLQAALASRAEILFSLSNAKAQIDFHTHKSYLSESPAGD